jgi:hypothetical protein
MKKWMLCAALTTGWWLALPTPTVRAGLPLMEIIRQGIKKVIKAMDLKLQRLQNQTLWLPRRCWKTKWPN